MLTALPALPGSGEWQRYGALHEAVAQAVHDRAVSHVPRASGAGTGEPVVVVSDADDLPAGPLVLPIDLDVVDSTEIAALGYPVTPGPSSSQVLAAARRVMATGGSSSSIWPPPGTRPGEPPRSRGPTCSLTSST